MSLGRYSADGRIKEDEVAQSENEMMLAEYS